LNSDWLYLELECHAAPYNMAFDEALLEAAGAHGQPLLRFYGWTEPAASFGYFQRIRDIEQLTALRPLVRRPTGGGLVPHDADWTYSLAFPPGQRWHQLSAVESYREVHEWILRAFNGLGVALQLSPGGVAGGGQCFAGAERFDVLAGARKVAGAAQRRNRSGLLIQGSIQPPSSVRRDDFQRALVSDAEQHWQVRWKTWLPSPSFRERVNALVEQKYARREYNEKR
jgi:lipoate-protein ligase A